MKSENTPPLKKQAATDENGLESRIRTSKSLAKSLTNATWQWLAYKTNWLVLLVGLSTLAFVQGTIGRQVGLNASKNGGAAIDTPLPLQWRKPWKRWQLFSWSSITLSAPTVWVVGILLLINKNSDHPFFWISLPLIVAMSNAVTIFYINQQHHRIAFTSRGLLAIRYIGISMGIGCLLFLITGGMSGLLNDLGGTHSDSITKIVWSALLTTGFGILSFAHAGTMHAWLAFGDDSSGEK